MNIFFLTRKKIEDAYILIDEDRIRYRGTIEIF